jgi:hypothetical protein
MIINLRELAREREKERRIKIKINKSSFTSSLEETLN